MKHFNYLLVSVLILLAGCEKSHLDDVVEREDIPLTKSQLEMVENGNDFAFNYFRNSFSGKAVTLSPISLERA